ncbi:hypothetical protein B0O99DRAFT_591986 [Bisporella sp. PMI_857]|nr:hypothetical protein B0O99DRAFT_591986 [Bisporella sp. PMI_857]
MPKGHRSSRSHGYTYSHLSPSSTSAATSYPPISARPSSLHQPQYYSSAVPVSLSHSYQTYSTGGPVQPLSYAPMPLQQPPLTSIRASSGAWNPQDDATLMHARSQGMNWLPIQQAYFPNKSANACRKRHERLMDSRRNADDWDGARLETLAKHYMEMRREIWQGLAQATGEKWTVVEQKCMAQGLKNLQTQARSCARRERMLDTSSNSLGVGGPYQDDSGIGDDYEAPDYDADGVSEHSGGSHGNGLGGGYYGHQSHDSQGSAGSRMSAWIWE